MSQYEMSMALGVASGLVVLWEAGLEPMKEQKVKQLFRLYELNRR